MPEATTTQNINPPTEKSNPFLKEGTPKDPAVILRQATIIKKKRKLNPAILIVGLLVLAAAIWYFFIRSTTQTGYVVRYATVEVGDVSKAVTATGTLQATKTVQVGSQVSGTIKELHADFNTHVTKGELLAVLDPTFYQATVTQGEANLARAEADYQNAQKDEARQRDLLKRQLIAQADYELSKTKLLDAEAGVHQQQAILQQAQVNLSYTIIHSPISGTVVSRNVDVGQTVAASLNAPVLFTIAEDLAKMQVSASVDEADIGQVQPGQNVKFTVDAYPGEPFIGVVEQVRINPVTAQNVVTYAVIITTDNPDGKLLPGMTATVNIINASRTGVLRIPSSAIKFSPPAELLSPGANQVRKSDSSAKMATRRPRHSTDTVRAGKLDRPVEQTIYMRGKTPTGLPLQAIKVITGLSDGAMAEVVSSNPPLNQGDSIATAAFAPAGSTASASSSSSPLNSRPGGGSYGGGGGPRPPGPGH